MDGISALTARIHQIEAVIGSLAPRAAAVPPTASPVGPVGPVDFAGVLAAETAATPARGTADPSLTPEQRANAEAVVAAGRSMGLSLRDQAIGVMTAMGESSLRVLDHGDRAGPDSRGLFQQRDNGAWGTLADRMDPTRSSMSFFTALRRVDGRDSMAPTLVAHTVQRNADPDHYARWWDEAVAVVGRITGAGRAQITG